MLASFFAMNSLPSHAALRRIQAASLWSHHVHCGWIQVQVDTSNISFHLSISPSLWIPPERRVKRRNITKPRWRLGVTDGMIVEMMDDGLSFGGELDHL